MGNALAKSRAAWRHDGASANNIGAWLTAWRERLGLTAVAATEKLGCSRNSLSRWESGEAKAPLYVILACTAIEFGLPPIMFWKDDDFEEADKDALVEMPL